MSTIPEPKHGSKSITRLIDRCVHLCGSVEEQMEVIKKDKDRFLSRSLGDALQQLELLLRVMTDRELKISGGRSTFKHRLFVRDEFTEASKVEEFEPPEFDVSRQGLQGNSWTVSLSELLGFLAFGNKSGVLWVDGPFENFVCSTYQGKLTHAASDRTPEGLRIGEILVGMGYITRRQLERFLEHARAADTSVSGEAFMESGMISAEELHAALVYQVRHLFFRMINTRNAVFRFREGMQVALKYQINLKINQLLLECAQATDEIAHEDQRTEAALHDWNAWQADLEVRVTGLLGSDEPPEPGIFEAVHEPSPAEAEEAEAKSELDADAETEAGAESTPVGEGEADSVQAEFTPEEEQAAEPLFGEAQSEEQPEPEAALPSDSDASEESAADLASASEEDQSEDEQADHKDKKSKRA